MEQGGERPTRPSIDEMNAKLKLLKEKERQRRTEMNAKMKREIEARSKYGSIEERTFYEESMEHLRGGTVDDYTEWLKGYMLAGGEPTNTYERNMGTDRLFVAQDDFFLPDMYGAASVSVIVPEGITVSRDEEKAKEGPFNGIGHNKVYYMDGFVNEGEHVPLYSDIEFE